MDDAGAVREDICLQAERSLDAELLTEYQGISPDGYDARLSVRSFALRNIGVVSRGCVMEVTILRALDREQIVSFRLLE